MNAFLWANRMVQREIRRNGWRFLTFSLAVSLGVAALVTTEGFAINVDQAMRVQSKSLVGADLILSGNQEMRPETFPLLNDLPFENSSLVSFASMVQFTGKEGTRLARIRAIDGGFPYYGELETDPPEASQEFVHQMGALVDSGLMNQFSIEIGDEILIGESKFTVSGRLLKIPGEAALISSVGPRVFIPFSAIDRTELVKKGSRVTYRKAFRTPVDFDADAWAEKHKQSLRAANVSWDTVVKRRENIGDSLDNLFTFLNLIGIAALLIGGMGVASSMMLFARSKLKTIALLRCLGATSRHVMLMLVAYALVIALMGTLLGLALGVVTQLAFPAMIREFLPMEIEAKVIWSAVARAGAVSLAMAFCFALVPFSKLWSVTPLILLRQGSHAAAKRGSRMERIAIAVTLCVVVVATMLQSPSWTLGLTILSAFAGILLVVMAVAYLLMRVLRRLPLGRLPFAFRQGLSNIYRPHNQSLMVIVAVGLVTFAIVNHMLVHNSLVGQFEQSQRADRPNLILFDIQSDQRTAVDELAQAHQLLIGECIPMVTMRLTHRNQTPLIELIGDESSQIPEWAVRWEYRSSYRATLRETEKVTAGSWVAHFEAGIEGTVPVSIETSIAETLHVEVGDQLTFDIQGIPVETQIASLREVDWQSMQPNFYILFPAGVLEDAPQIFVQAMTAKSLDVSSKFQQELVQQLPNVSAVDLRLLLSSIDDVVGKARFAVRFMAAFFMGAAFIVLATSLFNTRFERVEEASILRALGAKRSQVTAVLAFEFMALGSISTLLGVLIAVPTSYLISTRLLNLSYQWSTGLIAAIALTVVGVTMFIGSLSAWGVWRRNVMQVLRSEANA